MNTSEGKLRKFILYEKRTLQFTIPVDSGIELDLKRWNVYLNARFDNA